MPSEAFTAPVSGSSRRYLPLLHTDLSHISGDRVALGDMNDIRNLVEIMAALSFVRPREGAHSDMPMRSAALQPGGMVCVCVCMCGGADRESQQSDEPPHAVPFTRANLSHSKMSPLL